MKLLPLNAQSSPSIVGLAIDLELQPEIAVAHVCPIPVYITGAAGREVRNRDHHGAVVFAIDKYLLRPNGRPKLQGRGNVMLVRQNSVPQGWISKQRIVGGPPSEIPLLDKKVDGTVVVEIEVVDAVLSNDFVGLRVSNLGLRRLRQGQHAYSSSTGCKSVHVEASTQRPGKFEICCWLWRVFHCCLLLLMCAGPCGNIHSYII